METKENDKNIFSNITFLFSGTFLIPYMVIMCLVGYPLLVMEIGIGQKLRHDSTTIWTTINPQLGGISIVMSLVTIAMACYYGIIITWGTKNMVDTNKVNTKFGALKSIGHS